jgi:hypothetical protein
MFTPDLKEKQMKRYVFWYSETLTSKGFFDAESLEEAQELLSRFEQGEIGSSDLPSFSDSLKAVEVEVDLSSLEGAY